MTLLRPLVHGAALALSDLLGIGLGAVLAFHVTGSANEVWLQLPIAVATTVGVFTLWIFAIRLRRLSGLRPRNGRELGWCLFASLGWAAVVFIPLHFFTQGYLTGIGNMVALALYQMPVNVVALFCSTSVLRSCVLPPLRCQNSKIPT